MRSSEILAEARRWIDTPYRHQAAKLGSGVDCIGLIVSVGRALELLDMTDKQFAPYAGYSRTPSPRRMRRAMDAFLWEIGTGYDLETVPDGTIAWMHWTADLPMHLGIIGTHPYVDARTLIHAYSGAGKCTEHIIDSVWDDRIHSFWQYPREWTSEA